MRPVSKHGGHSVAANAQSGIAVTVRLTRTSVFGRPPSENYRGRLDLTWHVGYSADSDLLYSVAAEAGNGGRKIFARILSLLLHSRCLDKDLAWKQYWRT